jgi:hypothetical protein
MCGPKKEEVLLGWSNGHKMSYVVLTFVCYDWGDEIKGYEMSEAYSTHGTQAKYVCRKIRREEEICENIHRWKGNVKMGVK